MNDRSRIQILLSGRVPDRVPWFGDLAYWAEAMEIRDQVPENWQRTEDYYRFHRELGVGFYLQGDWGFRQTTDRQVQIETRVRSSDFIEGASNVEWMIEQYCGRSLWYNTMLRKEVARLGLKALELSDGMRPDEMVDECLSFLSRDGKQSQAGAAIGEDED